MESNQNPESIRQLFAKVQDQLNQTLQCRDSLAASRCLTLAEKAMAKIEGMILADPGLTEDDLHHVVKFTRGGALWSEARRHLAALIQPKFSRAAS